VRKCVLLVTNAAYLSRALKTILEVRVFGRFQGDIVLMVGDDLLHALPVLRRSLLRIIPIHRKDLDLTNHLDQLRGGIGLGGPEFSKTFQYHKFYCFDVALRRWNRILYIDAGMRVNNPIRSLLKLECEGALLAHSDAFPEFKWVLRNQFNFEDFPKALEEMKGHVSLESDYFQTTMMLYDSAIIRPSSVSELLALLEQFPNSRTNDQGIINLWALERRLWKPLPTNRVNRRVPYDFCQRGALKVGDYTMLKYPPGRRLRKHFITDSISDWYFQVRLQRKLSITLRRSDSS
jgi:hypothetical protein